MKPSPIQLAFGYVAATLQMVVVFHTSLRISDTLSDVLQVIALGCWVPFFVIYYRRRKAASAAGIPITVAPAQQKRTARLFIITLVVAALSTPLWLPYTGVVLPFWEEVIVSLVSFVFALAVFFLARRLMRPKT